MHAQVLIFPQLSSSNTSVAETITAQLTETTAISAAIENESKTPTDLNIESNNERQELLRRLSEKGNKLEALWKGADDAGVVTLKL